MSVGTKLLSRTLYTSRIAQNAIRGILIGGLLAFAYAAPAFADFESPTKSRTFEELILNIATWVARVALPFLILAIIWAGFKIVSARGNEEQLTSAKQMLYWSIIGAVVVIAAPTVTEIIMDIF